MKINEPTAEQCSAHETVYEDECNFGVAILYPQMGGYVGKAVAVFGKADDGDTADDMENQCFDVYVWHDGEFPFHDGEDPVVLHHCSAEQFVRFGESMRTVLRAASGS